MELMKIGTMVIDWGDDGDEPRVGQVADHMGRGTMAAFHLVVIGDHFEGIRTIGNPDAPLRGWKVATSMEVREFHHRRRRKKR